MIATPPNGPRSRGMVGGMGWTYTCRVRQVRMHIWMSAIAKPLAMSEAAPSKTPLEGRVFYYGRTRQGRAKVKRSKEDETEPGQRVVCLEELEAVLRRAVGNTTGGKRLVLSYVSQESYSPRWPGEQPNVWHHSRESWELSPSYAPLPVHRFRRLCCPGSVQLSHCCYIAQIYTKPLRKM